MATPVFAVRGNSLNAYYCPGGGEGIAIGDTAGITVVPDAAFLSGSKIQFTGATIKVLNYPGRLNTPNGRDISILHRVAPGYAGFPATGNRALMPNLYVGPDRMGRLECYHNASGQVLIVLVNETSTAILNQVNIGTWSAVLGVINDWVLITNGVNMVQLWLNGSLFGSLSFAIPLTPSWNNRYFNSISYGNALISATSQSSTDEIVIFDGILNVASAPLVSGLGPLSGPSRTSLVSVPNFDGTKTDVVAAGELKHGLAKFQKGVQVLGTYRGADLWSPLPAADIRAGITQTQDGLPVGGLLNLPGTADVRAGVAFDNNTKVGTMAEGSTLTTATLSGPSLHREPKLLNPTKVKFAQKNEVKQQYDNLRRTPINVIAKDTEFVVEAQIKWNVQLGEFGNPDVKQLGTDEREMGYMILRTKDLEAISKVIKRGDRVLEIGGKKLQFYVLRTEFGSHYNGIFKLVKVVFSDRLGQDG